MNESSNQLSHHFATMACNNAWANHRLLSAMRHLSDEEFAAARTSFFPSLSATLNHNITVDWYYVDALERGLRDQPPNLNARSFFEPEQPYVRCSELYGAQRAVDRRLVDLCVALRDHCLDTSVGILRQTGVEHETVSRVLAHLFEHQIHHRGQAHAMLSGTAVAPPQLDEFFCANDAHLRTKDFAELGYSEEIIWSP